MIPLIALIWFGVGLTRGYLSARKEPSGCCDGARDEGRVRLDLGEGAAEKIYHEKVNQK